MLTGIRLNAPSFNAHPGFGQSPKGLGATVSEIFKTKTPPQHYGYITESPKGKPRAVIYRGEPDGDIVVTRLGNKGTKSIATSFAVSPDGQVRKSHDFMGTEKDAAPLAETPRMLNWIVAKLKAANPSKVTFPMPDWHYTPPTESAATAPQPVGI